MTTRNNRELFYNIVPVDKMLKKLVSNPKIFDEMFKSKNAKSMKYLVAN